MKKRTWVIIGATSIIAEHFARQAAEKNYNLRLVGRDEIQLQVIARDLQLRYPVRCTVSVTTISEDIEPSAIFDTDGEEVDVFIAHSDFTENSELTAAAIKQAIHTNITATILLIHYYFNSSQQEHRLIYLSSIAACRGRAKNSFYAGTKAAVERYLQGLQHAAKPNHHILIAHLGYIDTKQTFGLPHIFYAASPKSCAIACWRASFRQKNAIYYPWFWRILMVLIKHLPLKFLPNK